MADLPAPRLTPLRLTGLATFWFVLKSPVGKEELLAGSENKFRSAIDTLQHPVPVLHTPAPLIEQSPTRDKLRCGRTPRGLCRSDYSAASGALILFVSGLLACPLASQGRLDSFFLTRFQVERVPFDFLYDVFLLNLSFEAAKRVFQGLPVLKSYFSQPIHTPVSDWNIDTTTIAVVFPYCPIEWRQVKRNFPGVLASVGAGYCPKR